MSTQHKPPKILNIEQLATSRLFRIESLDLEFSNGELRTYERIMGHRPPPAGPGAVMTVPLQDDHLLLVKEYAAGTNRYELGFPKGVIDPGESPLQAANRELQEEIGFAANRWQVLKDVTLAPSYFSGCMQLLLATDLFPSKSEGDEPEPLQIVRWPIAQARELLFHADFSESRSVTALLLALHVLEVDQ